MKKIFWSVFFLISTSTFAQKKIDGVVKNEKNETLFGVKIFSKFDKTINAKTDVEGKYSIVLNDTSSYLLFKQPGYDVFEVKMDTLKDVSVLKRVTLISPTKKLKVITISGKPVKSNETFMENVKKNSSTTIDYISAETIKKTGDPNVVAAISRVSGVSQSGGLITVRGIGDRYVKTTLNGSRIPTLDPLTNNIKLDIFPSSLIDNIVITKTASPDLPGDFSGAYISVETKDYPSKLEVNLESQFNYNSQTTFKEVISTQRSSTDWIGFDNGLRNTSLDNFKSPSLNPTSYQEMKALGLEDYFKKMGVSSWRDGTPEANSYFKLGLVELGLLSKAEINDNVAYSEAKSKYDKEYKPQAFSLINQNNTDYSNGFSNNWNTQNRIAPINFSQNFSVGNQITVFGKTVGFLMGVRYGNSLRYDPNGISQRLQGDTTTKGYDTQDNARISREINGINGLFNVTCKFNTRHALTLVFMPNFSGTNDAVNFNTINDGTKDQEVTNRVNQFYEQRRQLIYQVKSVNQLFKSKLKAETFFSYTKGSSIAPDFKVIQFDYQRNNLTDSTMEYVFSPTAGDGIRRYFRFLDENIADGRVSGEMKLGLVDSTQYRKLKFGFAYQNLDRTSHMEEFFLDLGNKLGGKPLLNNDINSYLNSEKFILKNGAIDFIYNKTQFDRNHTFGYSTVRAGFAMIDLPFSSGLRLAGGVRVEQSIIFSDVIAYNLKGYKKNDIRRENLGGFPLVNPADINEVNFLPSINIVYSLKKVKKADINMRVNFSQTIARPSIRELNDAAVFDNEFRTLIYGNSDLKLVNINNYDFRAESYFKNKDQISLSLFHKDFKNHIEMGFGSAGITWQNIDNSVVQGIEFEGKKNLGKVVSLNTNITLVKSVSSFIRKDMQLVNGIKQFTNLDTVDRPMFGQAPYVINSILNFKLDSAKINIAVSYNVQGPRLVITGVVKGFPDVYEMPRNTVDFKVSKTFGKSITTSFMIRDILNAPVRRAYKMNNGWIDFDNFRYGANFFLSIGYKFL